MAFKLIVSALFFLFFLPIVSADDAELYIVTSGDSELSLVNSWGFKHSALNLGGLLLQELISPIKPVDPLPIPFKGGFIEIHRQEERNFIVPASKVLLIGGII